jgi:hypothetical protein
VSLIPPFDVNVSSRRRSCILDVPLALSPCGLLFTVRVAQELNVWLVRTLWHILDNTRFYLDHPDLLVPASKRLVEVATDGADSVPPTVGEWEQARLESDLLGLNVFWAGDARHESLLPKGMDSHLVERFEQVAEELDLLWTDRGGESTSYDPLKDCHRDAAALAMALAGYAPMVLTVRGDGATGTVDEAPPFCRYLEECGIPSTRVDGASPVREVKSNLAGIFARTGAAELFWAGLDLAIVHLVAPHALVIGRSDDEEAIADDRSDLDRNLPWHAYRGATAWWWVID